MSRYENNEIRTTNYKLKRGKEINNRRYIETTIYQDINDSDDKFITAQRGDRLDLISYKEYGTPEYWHIIANANNIKDTIMIMEGQIIKIPYLNPGFNEMSFNIYNKER